MNVTSNDGKRILQKQNIAVQNNKIKVPMNLISLNTAGQYQIQVLDAQKRLCRTFFSIEAPKIPTEELKNLIESQIEILYFDKYDYKAFRSLYKDPSILFNEEQFNTFRSRIDVISGFGPKSQNVKQILDKLTITPISSKVFKAEWKADPKRKSSLDKIWMIENVNGKWLFVTTS